VVQNKVPQQPNLHNDYEFLTASCITISKCCNYFGFLFKVQVASVYVTVIKR